MKSTLTEHEWHPGTVRTWNLITLVMWDMSLGVGGLVFGLLFFLAMIVVQQFWIVLVVWILIAVGLSMRRATRVSGSACSLEPW